MADADLSSMLVTIEHRFAADPDDVWLLLTDLPAMAAFSPEVEELTWLGSPATAGSSFQASNHRGGTDWTVLGHVLEADRPTRFVWCISDPAHRSSTWSYDLRATPTGTLVRQQFRHGPGRSMIRAMIEARPDAQGRITAWRSQMLAQDMEHVLRTADVALRRRGS